MDRNKQDTTKQLVNFPHKGVNLEHISCSAVVAGVQAVAQVDIREFFLSPSFTSLGENRHTSCLRTLKKPVTFSLTIVRNRAARKNKRSVGCLSSSLNIS